MTNPKIEVLQKIYSHFSKGDLQAALPFCADAVTFQISGKSKLAGKYTAATVRDLETKMKELSGGSFQLETHDLLASSQHATVLATASVVRGGKKVELRTVHVWRFDGDKPLAWYEYPRDLYQFDDVWS